MPKQKYIIFGLLFAIIIAAFTLRIIDIDNAIFGMPAVFSTLLVLGVFLLASELFQDYIIGLMSAFIIAFSYWATSYSRDNFELLILPIILVFSFYFLLRGFRLKQLHNFIISGLIFGLGFYSYAIFIFFCLVLIPFLTFLIIIDRKFLFNHWKHIFVFIISISITAVLLSFGLFHINISNKILSTNPLFYIRLLNPLLIILFPIGFSYTILKFLQSLWHHFQGENVHQKICSCFFLNLWILLPFFLNVNFNLTALLPAVIIISTIPIFLVMKRYNYFGHAFRIFITSALSFVLVFMAIFDIFRYFVFLQNK